MTKLERIKSEAAALSPRQREDLVQYLVQAELGEFHPDVRAAWVGELKRRAAAVRSGKVKLVPHSQVVSALRKKLR